MSRNQSPRDGDVKILADALASHMLQVGGMHFNTEQTIIITTEDRTRLCLRNHLDIMEKRREWIAPAGILATLIVVFPTTTFQDFIFGKDVWKAIFLVVALLCAVWFIRAVVHAFKSHSIDDIINELTRRSIRPTAGQPQSPGSP